MNQSIVVSELVKARQRGLGPQIIDVRRTQAFEQADSMIAGAIYRNPADIENWRGQLDLGRPIVVYCAHGHEVSQQAARRLTECGYPVAWLEGGFESWRQAAGELAPTSQKQTRWVTREMPKIDRIACPWLIRRFIDPDAAFFYVPARDVLTFSRTQNAIAYDIPDVAFTHVGDLCSFDAFICAYTLKDPALLDLAEIVRGADTNRFDLSPQSAGLFAISLGLSANFPDDQAMLRHGMVVYDALYRWRRDLHEERHNWPPNMQA